MKAVETLWGTVALKADMMSTTRCSGHSVHDLNLCKNYTSALLTLRLGVPSACLVTRDAYV